MCVLGITWQQQPDLSSHSFVNVNAASAAAAAAAALAVIAVAVVFVLSGCISTWQTYRCLGIGISNCVPRPRLRVAAVWSLRPHLDLGSATNSKLELLAQC